MCCFFALLFYLFSQLNVWIIDPNIYVYTQQNGCNGRINCTVHTVHYRFLLGKPEALFMNVTYNVVEVSGHNLESSQTWISFKPFLFRGGRRVEVTVNAKEETTSDFCLICIQEFGLWIVRRNLSFLDKLVHIIVVALTYVIQRVGNTLYWGRIPGRNPE